MKWIYVLSISLPPILILANYVFKTIPDYSETLKLKAIYGEIIITRTSKGIPNIKATCIEDAFFALGYAQAMDRLWQMDMLRRTADGTLAEVFGESVLEKDVFSRNMKFKKNAVKLSSISPKGQLYMQRYTDGINSYAQSHYLPIEYFLSWIKWRRWEIADSLSIWRYLSFVVSMDYQHDLLRSELSSVLGSSLGLLPLDELLQFDQYYSISSHELPRELYKVYKYFTKDTLPGEKADRSDYYNQNSNAWVVSGDFTASGKPILSNDPHFIKYVPCLLYLASVDWGTNHINGGIIPGIPVFIAGDNGVIAWGGTGLGSDNIDLYTHEIANSKYLYDNNWLDLETFKEDIKIKKEPTRTYTFQSTNSGPVLYNKTTPISIRWAADEVLDTSFDGYLDLLSATTVRAIRLSLAKVVIPNLNMLYGNIEGDIGYQAIGVQPLRTFLAAGIFKGNDPELRWTEFIKFEEMPYCINPPKGYIVATNSRPITQMYKHYASFGGEFSEGRGSRIDFLIQDLIKTRKKLSVSDMVEIQLDEYSRTAATLVPIILKSFPNKKTDKIFSGWDFRLHKNSKEAGLFMIWYKKFIKSLLEDELGADLNSKLCNSKTYRNFIVKSISDNTNLSYCDDVNTNKVESCQDIVAKSMEFALSVYSDQTWGEMHESRHQHLPFGFNVYLAGLFDLKIPIGGSDTTVNSHSFYWDEAFTSSFGVAGRFVFDLGSPEDSRWGISTGQSGNVFSPHYSDQHELFHTGNLLPIKTSPKWESRLTKY